MRRRQPEFNYWPGVADTMLIAFIILLALSFGQQWESKLKIVTGTGGIRVNGDVWRKLNGELGGLREDNTKLQAELRAKDEEIKRAKNRIGELEKIIGELHGKVASTEKERDAAKVARMIELHDNEGFRFPSGTAELTGDFNNRLNAEIFPKIEDAIKKYNPNTIEVIGHTDGQPVRRRGVGNLDALLGDVLPGRQPVEALRFGSNADLGLIRAAVVRRQIEAWLSAEGLADKIKVRCYSAANSVPLTDRLDDPAVFAGEDAVRRRIEIRFTQLAPAPVRLPPLRQ